MKNNNYLIYSYFLGVVLPFWQNYPLPMVFLFISYLMIFNVLKIKYTLNKWPFKLLIFFGTLLFIFFQFGTLKGLKPGVNILTLITLLKTLEITKKGDLSIFFMLGLLTLTANLMTSETIAHWPYLFLILSSFFILTMEEIFTKKRDEFFKERIRVLVRILALSIPSSLLLFFFFPRIGVGSFFDVASSNSFKLGFTEKLRPGDISKISSSKEIYFRAKFNKGKEPLYRDLYWRGGILSLNQGFNWSKGKQSYNREKSFSRKKSFNYDLSFSNLEKTPIFVLNGAKKIKPLSKGKVSKKRGNTFNYTPFSNQKIRINVVNYSFKYRELFKNEQDEYLQVSDDLSPKILELTQKLKGVSAQETIDNIKDFFISNKFQYTLAPGSYQNKEGLEDFLFKRKLGFCEHFASSFSLLLRLAGVPSRVVTGFMGGTYNPFGKYYFITGQDAHAWVEAWVEGKGWVRVDPTFYVAPLRIERGAAEYFYALLRGDIKEGLNLAQLNKLTWIFKSRLIFDLIYYRLNHFFFNFDFEFQNDWLKRFWSTKRPRTVLFLLAAGICALVLILFKFFLYRKKIKDDELVKYFKIFCKKIGNHPEPYEGPLSFKYRLASNRSDQESFGHIISLFMELKYNPSFDQKKLGEFISRVKEFKPNQLA